MLQFGINVMWKKNHSKSTGLDTCQQHIHQVFVCVHIHKCRSYFLRPAAEPAPMHVNAHLCVLVTANNKEVEVLVSFGITFLSVFYNHNPYTKIHVSPRNPNCQEWLTDLSDTVQLPRKTHFTGSD